jgi:hypothetical protein
MDKLIGILRRFSVAFIWIIGILISLSLIIGGYNTNDNLMLILGSACFFLTWLLTMLINWIFGN